jgi:hypothetical protein
MNQMNWVNLNLPSSSKTRTYQLFSKFRTDIHWLQNHGRTGCVDVGPESVAPLIGEPWFWIFVCCCETLEMVGMKPSSTWGPILVCMDFVEEKFSLCSNSLNSVELDRRLRLVDKVTALTGLTGQASGPVDRSRASFSLDQTVQHREL